jgi:uncharacterized membrane protein
MSMSSNQESNNEESDHPYSIWDRVRLINFTDGIFAIAITLLAFNLRLPAVSASFGARLFLIRGNIIGFFVSFAVIGYVWLSHNRMFQYIREVDRRTFLIHLVFLAAVSFLPFSSTALEDNGGNRGAVIFYAVNVFLVVFMQLVIWLYVRGHKALIDPSLEPRTITFITAVYSFTPVVLLGSIVVSIFSAAAGELVLLLLLVERLLLRQYYHVRRNQAE